MRYKAQNVMNDTKKPSTVMQAAHYTFKCQKMQSSIITKIIVQYDQKSSNNDEV